MILMAAYDIADDQRRDRVNSILLDYGSRVQESVFWLDIDDELRARMELRLHRAVNLDEDILWIVPLCARCRDGMSLLGKTHPPSTPGFWIV